MNKDTTTNS